MHEFCLRFIAHVFERRLGLQRYFAMQTFLGSVKKRSASSPSSRPTPLCLMPTRLPDGLVSGVKHLHFSNWGTSSPHRRQGPQRLFPAQNGGAYFPRAPREKSYSSRTPFRVGLLDFFIKLTDFVISRRVHSADLEQNFRSAPFDSLHNSNHHLRRADTDVRLRAEVPPSRIAQQFPSIR